MMSKLPMHFLTMMVMVSTPVVAVVDPLMDLTDSSHYSDDSSFSIDHTSVILEPYKRTTLSAEISSMILSIPLRMGESFKKGDTLVHLDKTKFEAAHKRAQAIYNKETVSVNAKRSLFNDGVVSEIELKEAEAELASAEAELIIAQKEMEACEIKAPFDGKVVDVKAQEYEITKLDEQLIEIIDDRQLIAKFIAPSSLLHKLKVGTSFSLSLNESGEIVTAEVVRVGAIIEPTSSTVKVELKIDNSDGIIKAGMTGSLDLSNL